MALERLFQPTLPKNCHTLTLSLAKLLVQPSARVNRLAGTVALMKTDAAYQEPKEPNDVNNTHKPYRHTTTAEGRPVHGGPGTGKSFFVESILQEALNAIYRNCSQQITQWENDTQLFLHSHLPRYQAISIKTQHLKAGNPSTTGSTSNPSADLPFGGIAQLYLGDFSQILPVSPAETLYQSMLNLSTEDKVELIEKMRAAKDPLHMAFLNQLRSSPENGIPKYFNILKELKQRGALTDKRTAIQAFRDTTTLPHFYVEPQAVNENEPCSPAYGNQLVAFTDGDPLKDFASVNEPVPTVAGLRGDLEGFYEGFEENHGLRRRALNFYNITCFKWDCALLIYSSKPPDLPGWISFCCHLIISANANMEAPNRDRHDFYAYSNSQDQIWFMFSPVDEQFCAMHLVLKR
uniref:ATP-dependent DNA helicase n=1 Tax=Daphnia galeata TaxID=27404 RepID=A0A8J2RF87_9CRUS|nr:unnamed protein product [Daphnia galeata]